MSLLGAAALHTALADPVNLSSTGFYIISAIINKDYEKYSFGEEEWEGQRLFYIC